MPKNEGEGVLLSGLDGGNLLGFLAAVGTLRTATLARSDSEWRMKWVVRGGVWSPQLVSSQEVSCEELVALLDSALSRAAPEFEFAQNLAISPERFREVTLAAQRQASPQERGHADFMAAFGCEVLVNEQGEIQDTALRAVSGSGHQHFLGTMKQLTIKTSSKHLDESLFKPWNYSDSRLGLRWDPQEDRRYALRWSNPSGSGGVPTMRGANRLAVEALPLFPAMPNGAQLETTGFFKMGRTVALSWPIWDCALDVETVRSVLAMAQSQAPEPDRKTLHARGVREVYRSQRITVDKYRNFVIARPA